MNRIELFFLILLWTGTILILIPKPSDLKARIMVYLGLQSGTTESSGIAKFIGKIKSKYRKAQYEQELAESLAYIKNLVVLGRGSLISAELLLEELSDLSSLLSSVYLRMAGHLHLNEKNEAAECLFNAIGTKYSSDIGRFLSGWEDIPSSELLGTVEAYQNTLRESRETEQRRKDEIISDIIYMPVVVDCMAILLNFVYVGFFLQQKEALAILF